MSHLIVDQTKLLQRTNRIQGQINAIKKILEQEHGIDDCADLLQLIAACRGAINGLMLEVIEGHVRHHICDPAKVSSKQGQATQELLSVVKSYFK